VRHLAVEHDDYIAKGEGMLVNQPTPRRFSRSKLDQFVHAELAAVL
jgi:hypothetical protein